MFFKIAKGENDKDEVTVVTTRYQDNGMDYYRYIDPVADWCGALCLYAFNPASAGSFYMADFPVEISDDMNTVSIKSVDRMESFILQDSLMKSWLVLAILAGVSRLLPTVLSWSV